MSMLIKSNISNWWIKTELKIREFCPNGAIVDLTCFEWSVVYDSVLIYKKPGNAKCNLQVQYYEVDTLIHNCQVSVNLSMNQKTIPSYPWIMNDRSLSSTRKWKSKFLYEEI